MNNKIRVLSRLFIVLSCFLALTGCASVPANFQSVLQNMSYSYPNLWRLATASSYVMGFAFAMRAIHHMKIYGEARTMMSSHTNLKTPLMLLIVSAALIALPTTFKDVNMTFFEQPNILAYNGAGAAGFSRGSIEAIIGLVQLIGLVSFIRGWIHMARAGEQNSQPQLMGKGLTHIIGGLLAINIVQTKDVLWNTFGFS